MTSETQDGPIRIGISACLLGERVRYDGGHKQDAYAMGTLAPFVEWIPVCPELEVGMGVPREAVRLVGDPAVPRMVGLQSGTDWTARMQRYADDRVATLARMGLHGYILKSRSPTCGMERVKVYTADKGAPAKKGAGLFAAALRRALPALPVEEEGRLHDAYLRENFIVRVFTAWRWERFLTTAPKLRDLMDFHARHKYLLMAHSPEKLRAMGRLLAEGGRLSADLLERYRALLDAALQVHATPRKHVNVLQHIAGYYRDDLDEADRAELHQAIADYLAGLLPLIVPLTLVRHHARALDATYIRDQVYLHPHPKELMLLNHV